MSDKRYTPPYTVSEEAVNLIAEISAAFERYKIALEGPDGVLLRKINHIRTIRGTTAIEGNTLTEEQITAILDGKRVVAPSREIAEVKGAHAAYALLGKIDPFSIPDVLKVHSTMKEGLVKGAGAFRTGDVGVVDGLGHVLHMAPPASRVPALFEDLVVWAKASAAHPLVKSCVFHYEFEFIHPFFDGNGRMGRFLQTAMLGKWNPLFHAAPVENIVFENQAGYYDAINASTAKADSGPFIDFMLGRILQTIKTKGREHKDVGVNVGVNVGVRLSAREREILDMLRHDETLTALRIAETYSISTRQAERLLSSLKKKNLIRRVGPDKGGHWEVLSEKVRRRMP